MLEEFLLPEIKMVHHTEWRGDLSETLSGVRIAFFSDLHWQDKEEKKRLFTDLLQKLADEKPHLILIGGDIADQSLKKIPEEKLRSDLLPFLKQLHAPMGVYAVMGNHEAYCGKEFYRELFQEAGIRPLEDERVLLPSPSGKGGIILTGIKEKRWYSAEVKLAEVFEGPARPPETEMKDHVLLYVSHRPEVFDRLLLREDRVPFLLLSAHYHGGLMALPFLEKGYFLKKKRRYPTPYIYGLYRKEKSSLYVSSGLSGGYFTSTRRVNLPRELLIVTLQKGEKK